MWVFTNVLKVYIGKHITAKLWLLSTSFPPQLYIWKHYYIWNHADPWKIYQNLL